MPRYCFICPVCNEQREVSRPMKDSDLPDFCECGTEMRRDFTAEHSSVRGDYNEPIVSDSMAFDAVDLAEHRRRFPGVEVVVNHARSARPVFRNLNQKRRYMKKRGWIDCNSYT